MPREDHEHENASEQLSTPQTGADERIVAMKRR
jgi:hypothetical protein